MKNDCLFCKIINKEIDSKVIYEDELVIACLDAYPNVSGHTLIIPKQHYEDFTELPNDLIYHINQIAKELTPRLMNKFNSEALTICVNYGDSQAIKHYHLHLLPNYGAKYKKDVVLSRDDAYEIFNG